MNKYTIAALGGLMCMGLLMVLGLESRNVTWVFGLLFFIALGTMIGSRGNARKRGFFAYTMLIVFVITILLPIDVVIQQHGRASIRYLPAIEGEAVSGRARDAKALGKIEGQDYIVLRRKSPTVPTKWCVLITY